LFDKVVLDIFHLLAPTALVSAIGCFAMGVGHTAEARFGDAQQRACGFWFQPKLYKRFCIIETVRRVGCAIQRFGMRPGEREKAAGVPSSARLLPTSTYSLPE